MVFDLEGQVAIVTGGGRGIGRGIAQAIAGANGVVAVVARSEDQLYETVELITRCGGQAIAVTADITEPKEVEYMTRQVEQQLGPVDILINNAGVIGPLGPLWEIDLEDWRRTTDVNLYGSFLCSRAVLPGMIQRKKGLIVNVSSSAALNAKSYAQSYCISKTALLRLTECLAMDTKDKGIKVFAIDPGTVRTAMTEYIMESEEGNTYAPWFRKFMQEDGGVPPELSAKLVLLLASSEADNLSGRFIQVSDDIEHLILHSDKIQQDDLYTLRLSKLTSQ
jgi:NAD(P)-dependent dehydrogenase (short-subunit alcohol dehydrogenase family)